MVALLTFLLEGSIILLVMYAFYNLLLSKLTFFGWNRAFLLISLGLALSLPLISFEVGAPPIAPFNAQTFAYSLPEFEISATEGISTTAYLGYLALLVYGVGFLWFASRLLVGIFQTMFLIKSSNRIFHNGVVIAVSPKFSPSSFFNYILLPEYHEGNKAHQLIILHESEHASQFHTLDLLFMQAVKAIFWFHPMIKNFESSIHEVHEFQADTKVTCFHPKKEYAQLLLNLIVTKKEQQFVNNFNQFQLKKRIIMMNTAKSNLIQKGRFLLALPLLGLMILFFSCDFQGYDEKVTLENGEVTSKTIETDEVFDVVEDAPEFPGGMEAWSEFLANHLKYPLQAKEMGIEGTVYLVFEIRKDGAVKNIELLRGIGGGCDEEAMRIVKESPNWIPGKQRGHSVNVRMRLPIRFKLSEGEKVADFPKTIDIPK